MMELADWLKRRTMLGAWLGQSEDEPCPFDLDSVQKSPRGTSVDLLYDEICFTIVDGGQIRLAVLFKGKEVAYMLIAGAVVAGTTFHLTDIKGALAVTFT